jgi:cysteine synthase A
MFRYTARRLAVAVAKAAEPSAHTLSVSKAQGVAKGLTGGEFVVGAAAIATG